MVAATNSDLRKAVEQRKFREDLFYRLNVFDIPIAPLRERTDDILPLSDAFLQEIAQSIGRPPAGLTMPARDALLRHEWPGNVRELHNALERAAIVSEDSLIRPEDLELDPRHRSAMQVSPSDVSNLNVVERQVITKALEEACWNKSTAAKRLGLSRTQLYGRMRKYGLDEAPIMRS